MRSFSLLSVLAAAFTVVSAVTPPVGDPKGNAISKPGLNELVPVGKPYQITWAADTPGTVSILLLRGPSTNVVPIGPPIAEEIENTGTHIWTPSTDLEPDTTGYGIQIIVDGTGQYQYSTQFGISNPDYNPDESTTTTDTDTATGYPTTTVPSNTTSSYPTTTKEPTTTSEKEESTTTEKPETTEPPTTYEPTTLTTSVAPSNTTVPSPSNTTTVRPPVETDDDSAASSLFFSFGMGLISVAVAGFALL